MSSKSEELTQFSREFEGFPEKICELCQWDCNDVPTFVPATTVAATAFMMMAMLMVLLAVGSDEKGGGLTRELVCVHIG